ncbi:MAG: OmpA family protein [Polyangiales bacterium]
MRNLLSPRHFGAATAALALACAAPREAVAQGRERAAVRLEGGYGAMLSDYQRRARGFDAMWQGSARLGITLADPLALDVGVTNWVFPGGAEGTGWVFAPSVGLRLEPRVGRAGRLWFDAHAGVGLTGDVARLALDVGLGFEFRLGDYLALGPSIRYGQMVQPDSSAGTPERFPDDARYFSAGLTLAVRFASAPPRARVEPEVPAPVSQARAPADDDGDGVPDAEDLCPRAPQGVRPDPLRPGCATLDSDFDTVFDPDDHCVTQPQGPHPDPARPGCPSPDDDGDGTLNDEDRCPTERAGEHPDPARPGCPDGDRDHDGVRDGVDRCIDEPEDLNGVDDDDGCPDASAPPVALDPEHRVISLRGDVNFLRGSANLVGRASFETLDALASLLIQHPEIELVEVQGHTDARGPRAANLALSRRRAETAVLYLTSRGVAPSRLRAAGYGSDRPLDPRQTPDAWTLNRRTEVHVIRLRQGAGGAPAGR